ncbi:serine hydrolase domain-containing protein [Sphingopyxis sp.]|jgi:D-alanyl-D-alanine carboxypeptidase|uniref:serine hydrolase domain-containing protein n=1 Tax=Sphingopyxis sp. TaxID=1908224 RepID=UPI003F724262
MKLSIRPTPFLSSLLAPILAFTAAVASSPASAGPISTTMPDTAAGAIGGQVIAHINADTPASIQQWAPTILSTSVDADMRAALFKQLAVAVRDSGGVDFVDARTQGPLGMLVVTIKGRRTGQLAALVLLPDPDQPGKLAMVDLVPVDDPALYAAWPETGASQAEIARLAGAALDQLARTTDFSGCLSISDGAAIVFDECRGLADRSFGAKADRQTKFHIGSMNKMFTAVAIAQLVETGRLRWDTTLADVMPEYPDQAAAAKITMWQLLHHTAGLGDFFVPEFFQNREKFVNPGDYLDLIARQPKSFEPGQDWNYSNAGYVLLGRIVENVSGESYFEYVRRHIFAPAGMTSSGFDSQEDVTEKLATGYFKDGAFATAWKANWMTLPFKGSPAGGGYSTNGDLLRFASALRGGKLVKDATLQKMFDDGVAVGPGKYAAGFGDRPSNGRQIRGHAGGAEGMSANLAIVWETGAAVAVTSNQGDTPTAMLLSERIADLLAAQGQKP